MSKLRNKLNQDVYFAKNNIVKVPRSTFYRNQKKQMTFNMGSLYPIFVDEVLPGDTRSIDLASVIRVSNAFIKPVMDDLEFVAHAFFVPNRLCDSKWEQVIGGFQADPDWSVDPEVLARTISFPSTGWDLGSLADYMGLPVGKGQVSDYVSAYPFTAYSLIWNNWYRDENLQKSISVDINSRVLTGTTSGQGVYTTNAPTGGALAPLNKIHDFFTSCLPAPQKGSAVSIGLGGTAPVFGNGTALALAGNNGNLSGLSVSQDATTNWNKLYPNKLLFGSIVGTNRPNTDPDWINDTSVGVATKSQLGNNPANSGLIADLSSATAIPINNLRYAFQLQLIKEADARNGTRYREYLLSHFGVLSADSRLQIPEYLGSYHLPLDITQVTQTSATPTGTGTGGSPQGTNTAYSLSSAVKHVFTKSFTEHGILMIVGGVRVKHRTYSQGINKMWSRRSRFDWFLPELENIGEQPVLNKEIYYQGMSDPDNQVFGYQEAWAEYRYLPNQCCGYSRPNVSRSLAYYNFADNYNAQPTLSPAWISEDPANLNRCLVQDNTVVHHFVADFYIKDKAIRPIPLHGIPGLIDHSGKLLLE